MRKLVYGKVTNQQLMERFGIMLQAVDWKLLPPLGSVPVWLRATLDEFQKYPSITTEKYLSESVIAPVLLAVRNLNHVGLYSGVMLTTDEFTGICDFVIAQESRPVVMTSAIIAVVKAKKQDIEAGIPQCIAEMLASRAYNLKYKLPHKQVFGCVTTANEWQFLQLEEDNRVLFLGRRYFLTELPQILGIFEWMVNQFR